jgi:putative flippase GtrA
MDQKKLKRISLRASSYIGVGLVTTGGMWVTWNTLYWLGRFGNLDQNLVFSLAQYIASFIWILPSFYINRRLTFRDKSLQNSKHVVLGKVFLIYNIAPLVASLATYTIQRVLIIDLESMVFILPIAGRELSIAYMYFGLQLVGIAISMMINFFGQYFMIYKTQDRISQ